MSPLWLGALAMGFAGSGHCGAMCGAIASSPAATSAGRRTILTLSLNTGRLFTYATAGALVGGVGALLDEVSALHRIFGGLRGLTGVVLVALGIALALGVRSFAFLDRAGAPVWQVVRPFARRLSGPSTPPRALAFGALWGLLPCGLVYAALALAAATGSSGRGALTMLAFGAGTLPALVLIGSAASRLRALVARRSIRAAVGLLVVLSGFVNVASVLPEAWCGGAFASVTHACCHAKGEAP